MSTLSLFVLVWCQISSSVFIFIWWSQYYLLPIVLLVTHGYRHEILLRNHALAKHDLTSFPWCRWIWIDGKTVKILGHLSIGQCFESFFIRENGIVFYAIAVGVYCHWYFLTWVYRRWRVVSFHGSKLGARF